GRRGPAGPARVLHPARGGGQRAHDHGQGGRAGRRRRARRGDGGGRGADRGPGAAGAGGGGVGGGGGPPRGSWLLVWVVVGPPMEREAVWLTVAAAGVALAEAVDVV